MPPLHYFQSVQHRIYDWTVIPRKMRRPLDGQETTALPPVQYLRTVATQHSM